MQAASEQELYLREDSTAAKGSGRPQWRRAQRAAAAQVTEGELAQDEEETGEEWLDIEDPAAFGSVVLAALRAQRAGGRGRGGRTGGAGGRGGRGQSFAGRGAGTMMVPGTDGKLHTDKDCHYCKQWGHVKVMCPVRDADAKRAGSQGNR